MKSLLDAGIIHKSMSSWKRAIMVVKNHTPEGSQQQFRLCVDCRKLKSVLPSVTPAAGMKKGALDLILLPKNR